MLTIFRGLEGHKSIPSAHGIAPANRQKFKGNSPFQTTFAGGAGALGRGRPDLRQQPRATLAQSVRGPTRQARESAVGQDGRVLFRSIDESETATSAAGPAANANEASQIGAA